MKHTRKTNFRNVGKSLILLLGMTLIILTGCGSNADTMIRYGGQYYPEEFLLQGYPELWTEQDLVVEHILFSSGTENNQALIAGEIDINVGADSRTVALFNAMPEETVIIATSQRGDRYSTIVRGDSDFQSWEDLRGHTVGVRLGTGAEQVLLRYFELQPNLAWEDFEWVNLGVEDMIAALQSGSIDAFTAWEPTPAIAEAQGVGRVLFSYGDIALVPVSIHTTRAFAESHHDELVRFLAAHIAKVELIQNDPQRAAELAVAAAAAQGVEVSTDAFLRIFERVDFSLEFDEAALFALEDTAQFLYDQDRIDNIPEFYWDNSFLEEAQALHD